MKTAQLKLTSALVAISLTAIPPLAAAQSASSNSGNAPGQLAKAVCLTRKSDGPGNKDVLIAVPPSQQLAMQAKGYATRTCKSDAGAIAAYRAKVCEFASKAPQPLKDQVARDTKLSPQELCDMASGVTD